MTVNSKVLIIIEIDNEIKLYTTTKLVEHLAILRETKKVNLIAVFRKYYMWSESFPVIITLLKKKFNFDKSSFTKEYFKEISTFIDDKCYLQEVPKEFYQEYENFNYDSWKDFADELNKTNLVYMVGLLLEPVCEYMNKVDGKLVVQKTKLPIEEQNLRGELYYNKQYDDTKIRKPK